MATKKAYEQNLNIIINENQHIVNLLAYDSIEKLAASIQNSKRLFFAGAGRTGLALKMAAMRFMHLGYAVYVMGETVTPAILEGDLLIVGSGSGATSTLVTAGKKAKNQHATLAVLTADSKSTLAQLADRYVLLPAAIKTDFSVSTSQQYAGSLFEQSILLLFDAIFMTLWKESGLTKEDLWPKHANLE
ncbi:6-phospho-3-hexuloisomerase [Sphingobacterium sp. DN00404]|uniref:6-phospho-3-hexuloisomerase n=1 Tax=Sphingobacterium micropteri TaxID=2763501 RepID=A0ABR7YJX5_9SPHI|nr:6-phospho-3-hexuloisomerase [Sphingobacterium micropteri]MBD1431618.1 6-phospho-3-hexuloisomerase [Sphingobacterium micropteri]